MKTLAELNSREYNVGKNVSNILLVCGAQCQHGVFDSRACVKVNRLAQRRNFFDDSVCSFKGVVLYR